MKRWQHWILALLLWMVFLAVAAGILFLWKPGVRDLPKMTKEDRPAGEDKPVEEGRPAGEEGGFEGDGEEEKGEGMWLFAGRSRGMEYFSMVVRSGKLISEERGFPSGKGEGKEEQEGGLEPEPAESDGKMVDYLPQLLDAFIDEMIEARPDAFLLTGDITMNGERVNHEELAGKLGRLLDAGVPVLVIPGNHDIHNYRARLYFGDEEEETESVSLDEFTELYQDFGWNQAISRDEGSFSYIYPLREKVWLMLLDTAQYDPLNIVDGVVRPGTLAWMEENLEKAKELGIQVIVSGHHNLLQESRLFTDMCVLENSDEVLSLLERYRLPLYISGHLHLQRIQKHRREPGDGGYGIDEIVSDALSIPPCQYGVLSWDEDEGISYETRRVGVSAWAKKTGQEDEALLDFEHYQKEYVQELIKAQIMEKTSRLPESTAQEMAALYAKVYGDYCAGLKVRRRDIEGTKGYRSWQRYLPDSKEFKEIKSMVKDSMGENNFWESRGSE